MAHPDAGVVPVRLARGRNTALDLARAAQGETSYYPPLSGLLNAIGETLSPKVCWVIQLQNRGAGMPDGGMFTADIYLNEHCCCRNVPVAVWEYTLGGYQVVKKWLSYRGKPLLGRGLTIDEVRYVTGTARRIAALLALQPDLDANYKHKEQEEQGKGVMFLS